MSKITMTDIARLVVQKHHLNPNEAERLMTTIVDVINDGLRFDKQVKIKGFGTFKVIETKDRESVNINTGERILIGGRSKITFTPDPSMRDLVNRPFSQFETVVINDGVEFDDIETTHGIDDRTHKPLCVFLRIAKSLRQFCYKFFVVHITVAYKSNSSESVISTS